MTVGYRISHENTKKDIDKYILQNVKISLTCEVVKLCYLNITDLYKNYDLFLNIRNSSI